MRLRHVSSWAAILLLVCVAVAIAQTPQTRGDNKQVSEWSRSGHANIHSDSFSYWNKQGVIPPVCSTCHSGAGFRSLYGLDGSSPGLPQSPIPVGGVVDCETCHSPGLPRVAEIKLPSGKPHAVMGVEAACMTCHQGRASSETIERAVASKAEDKIDSNLRFINPHYAIAAASLLGGTGALGYQYAGKEYEPRFSHAPSVATCVSCHDPHNLSVAERTCLTCHQTGDSRAIRTSRVSYDGSGNLKTGIYADINANKANLLALISEYAEKVAGLPIVFDAHRNPYFFTDANRDGLADTLDGAPIAYSNWTPRLLKATYNWKFVGADAGIHVHNPHYALQLLHDSAADLSVGLGRNLTGMAR